jgi:L-glyceraldehyde 3-phosphate reductase
MPSQPVRTHAAAPDRYERMTYRRCGNSGLMLPALSLGFWHNFGAQAPADRQRAIAYRAFDEDRAPRVCTA